MTVWRQPEAPLICIRPIPLSCTLRNSAFGLRVRVISRHTYKSSNLPHIHLNHSWCSADLDDPETQADGSDLVLADISDSDTRSVDLLIDDIDGNESTSRSFPKVSM